MKSKETSGEMKDCPMHKENKDKPITN
jgi:hypothetical protein